MRSSADLGLTRIVPPAAGFPDGETICSSRRQPPSARDCPHADRSLGCARSADGSGVVLAVLHHSRWTPVLVLSAGSLVAARADRPRGRRTGASCRGG